METRQKKIWYVSHYVAPPKFDTHSRAIKFAKYLAEEGYEVTIFSSSYLHNKNIDLISDNSRYIKRNYDGIKFIHIKTKKYTTNGFSRFVSLFQFAIQLYLLKNKFEKPDIILHTAQVPFQNLVLNIAKKLKAKYIAEVLDLWPESFVAYGLLKKNNPLLKLAYFFEKRLYRQADKVIFSMEGGKDYLIGRKWNIENGGPIDLNKIFYINNGVDIKDFNENKVHFKIKDPDIDDENIFKVVYLGSIRFVNNIKQLIDAAELLKEHTKIKFLIYGDGNDRSNLEKYCIENDISNVIFKQKWVELKYVPSIVSNSSLNIINYMPTDILRYGGSQGKLFQYLAAGKPICSNIKMGYCLINKYNLGIAENFGTAQEYADAILRIASMNETSYKEMCTRTKNTVNEFDFRILTKKLIEIIK